MKKIIILTITLITILSSAVFAVRIDNNSEYFKNQPCYGLDNKNPSGTEHVIYQNQNYAPGKNQTFNQDIEESNKSITKNTVGGTLGSKKLIWCRIFNQVFQTELYANNFIPCGKGFLIYYHYTHDKNSYFIKYDEVEKLYRPYTQEELNAEIIRLNQ